MPAGPNQTSRIPVASDEAAILTALLPSRSAPIRRSRLASKRLTIFASAFPFFSSRAMLAREEAVSAVSLPAKNADSKRQINTTTRDIQSAAVIGASRGERAFEESADLGRLDVVLDECLPDAAHENERERAAFDLLVLCDQLHQDIYTGYAAGHVPHMGRQP